MSSCHWNYNRGYCISGFFQGRVFRQLKGIKEQALDQAQKQLPWNTRDTPCEYGPRTLGCRVILGQTSFGSALFPLHRNGNSQGKSHVAGLLPLWGTVQGIGAHSPFPVCVINSSVCEWRGG